MTTTKFKKRKVKLEWILRPFAYTMIAISFLVFLNQRILNSLAFWTELPSYKQWLGNKRANISGISLAVCTVTYFTYTWLFITGIIVYLLIKANDLNNDYRARNNG